MPVPWRRNSRRSRRATVSFENLEGRGLLTLSPVLLAVSPIFQRPAQAVNGLTPHEVVRERFTGIFSGQFIQGPGRTTSDAAQFYISGGGTANAFRHGDLQMALFVPKDPSAGVTGSAALIVKNVSNSGNLLGVDIQATTQQFDQKGRPTLLAWTVNGNSAGTFTSATGSGTVQIRYRSTHSGHKGFGTGGADVVFRGQIYTTGVGNVLRPIASVVK